MRTRSVVVMYSSEANVREAEAFIRIVRKDYRDTVELELNNGNNPVHHRVTKRATLERMRDALTECLEDWPS